MKGPLLVLAGCFALGIILAHREPARLTGIAFPFAFSALCLLIGLIALRAGWRWASWVIALAGFVFAGVAAARLFELRLPPNHIRNLTGMGVDLDDPVRLKGFLVSTPLRTSDGLQFDVEVRQIESLRQVRSLTGKVRLRLQASPDAEMAAAAESLHLQYGDFIQAVAKLRKPRSYQNPGSFDFRRWLETNEDLYWVGTVKSPFLVEKLPSAESPKLARLLEKTRRRLLEGIDRLYPPWSAEGRHGAVLKAVLLGDRSSLDSDTIEKFRKTGLYHLLVIAGLHVGLLAALAWFFLRLVPWRESWRSALVLLFLVSYALLVEERPPTLRATLMISLLLLARLFYRERVALNAIGFAALLLLLHRPAWLFEIGFQMSFAAALLIIALAVPILERTTDVYRRALWRLEDVDLDPSLAPRQAQFRLDTRSLIVGLKARMSLFQRHPALAAAVVTGPARALLWVANMLVLSAILQLGLLLLMAENFHRVTFVGIGLNAVAIPVMILLLGFAVPTVVLSATFPPLAVWPAKLLALIMRGLFTLTDLPGLPPWLSYRVPDPPGWVAWGFALSIVAAAWALGRRPRVFSGSCAACGIFATLIALHPFPPKIPRGALEVTALDCGGGDALFLVLADGTTMLVDAGGMRGQSTREGTFQGRRWDPGEDIVSPYLWSRGIQQIDIVALSHAHEDHLGGLFAVVRNFRVGEFWQGTNPPTPSYQALLAEVKRRGIPVRRVVAGDLIARGATSLRILWPPAGLSASPLSLNDTSVVVRILNGEGSVLLPGDISSIVEQELARSAAPLASQVLKVAHHGSKSSSSPEFLARVSPRVALVSAESGNFMNLPNPECLARLRASGARILRTDLDGAAMVEMRGGTLSARSYRTSAAD